MGLAILILVILIVGIIIGLMIGYSRTVQRAAERAPQTNPLTVARIIVLAGCLLLIATAATGLHAWNFTRHAVKASGTIIEMRPRYDRESNSTSYSPTFRFRDGQGGEHTVDCNFSTYPPLFQIGEKVNVLFRPDAPDKARIDSYWEVWGATTLLGGFSGVLLCIGLGLLYWTKFSDLTSYDA